MFWVDPKVDIVEWHIPIFYIFLITRIEQFPGSFVK